MPVLHTLLFSQYYSFAQEFLRRDFTEDEMIFGRSIASFEGYDMHKFHVCMTLSILRLVDLGKEIYLGWVLALSNPAGASKCCLFVKEWVQLHNPRFCQVIFINLLYSKTQLESCNFKHCTAVPICNNGSNVGVSSVKYPPPACQEFRISWLLSLSRQFSAVLCSCFSDCCCTWIGK